MKKHKTYNLKRSIYETINQLASADGRSDSDWLNIHLGNTLPTKEVSKPKTSLVKSEPKFNFKSELLALGVNEDVLSDWLKVRSKKKASNTKTALKGLLTEITKSGLMVNDAIEYAASKSWSGFKANWYFNEEGSNQAQGKTSGNLSACEDFING